MMKKVTSRFPLALAVVLTAGSVSAARSTDYVRRGLLAQWDALDNAGVGVHDAAATEWKDLSGNGIDWKMQSAANYRWSARGLEMLGKGCVARLAHHSKTNFYGKIVTVECVWCQTKAANGYVFDSGYQKELGSGTDTYAFTLIWFQASTAQQFSVWNPYVSDLTKRYGFGASVGVTNTYAAVYKSPNDLTPATGGKSLALNGTPCASATMADWWRPSTNDFQLGCRTHNFVDNTMANGTLLALRFYTSELTEEELALNAALDRVRLLGVAPNEAQPPAGYRFDADGNLERVAFVWTGAAGTTDWSDMNNWQHADARAAVRAPGRDGDKVEIASAAVSVALGRSGEMASLTLGAGASLTLADGTELRSLAMTRGGAKVDYGLYGAANAAWASGAGKVRVANPAAQITQYVQDGLVAHWDAINRAGGTVRDTRNSLSWKDLSTNRYDWTLGYSYQWEDDALRFLASGNRILVGQMPGRDGTTFQNKISTIELVWQSEQVTDAIIFSPGLGYTAAVMTLKDGSIDGDYFDSPGTAGDWIGFTDFKKNNYGTSLTVGATNVYSVTYARTGATPTAGASLYCGGAAAEIVDGKNVYNVGSVISLGGRYSAQYGFVPSKGRLMALRVYDRPLTKKEILINQALDRVRYLGADPASVLPSCRRFDADGHIVKTGLFLIVR